MFKNSKSTFDSYVKSYQAKHQKKDQNEKKDRKVDDRYIQFKEGTQLICRLINYPTDKRKSPFVEKYQHTFTNDKGYKTRITCPTSEYIDGHPEGFKSCPVCKEVSKLYKEYEAGSKTSEELYKMFKRKVSGVMMAYIIDDPANPANNGHVKLIRYDGRHDKWLKNKIYGSETEKRPYGFSAFDFDDGYDLIITVTKEGTYIKLAMEFDRERRKVDCDTSVVESEISALNFDDLMTTSTPEEIQKFYVEYVNREGNASVPVEQSRPVVNSVEVSDISDVSFKPAQKPIPTAMKNGNVKDSKPSGGKIDVNSLLNEIDGLSDDEVAF